MIIYFADRKFNILGLASTELQNGISITNDTKVEYIQSGVKTLALEIAFTPENRLTVQNFTEPANYILRSHEDENEFYTIIECEIDATEHTATLFCEDAGLDMINDVCRATTAPAIAQPISYYINLVAANSGFEIGHNEITDLKRALAWDSEDTAASRIQSVATQFDNAEISFSFTVTGLKVTGKYINVWKKRGEDRGVELRLNREVKNIVTSKSVANLATALYVTGGTTAAGSVLTLRGYAYDDGDICSPKDDVYLYSRSANQKWTRKNWETDSGTGWLVKQYSYDTDSQATLCSHAIRQLKKLCDTEINYTVDLADFGGATVNVGDTVYIIDTAGELFTSARVLELKTSVTSKIKTATLGDYITKPSGVDDRLNELASNLSSAKAAASIAQTTAAEAQTTADAAQSAVESAQTAAEKAQEAAESAKTTAGEAQSAASNAQSTAESAKTTATNAQTAAGEAQAAIESVQTTAETAKSTAESAQKTANNASQAVSTVGKHVVIEDGAIQFWTDETTFPVSIDGNRLEMGTEAIIKFLNGGIADTVLSVGKISCSGRAPNFKIEAVGSMGNSTIDIVADNVLVNGEPIGGGRGSSAACSARGAGTASTTASAGTSGTAVKLTQFDTLTDETAFEINGNGIMCNRAGVVLVNASVYIRCGTSSAVSGTSGCYVYKNGTEIFGNYSYTNAAQNTKCCTKIIPVAAGDVLTLIARANAAGSVYPANKDTHLDIMYIN